MSIEGFYVIASVGFCVMSMGLLLIHQVWPKLLNSFSPSFTHRMIRYFLGLCLILPFFSYGYKGQNHKIVSYSKGEFQPTNIGFEKKNKSDLKKTPTSLQPKEIKIPWTWLLVLGFFCRLWIYWKDLIKVNNIIAQSFCVKKINKIAIVIHEEIKVPFAFKGLTNRYIVIPSQMLENHKNYMLAIKHELQHHRQKDTDFCHLMQVLKMFFFWNIGVYWIEQLINQTNEYACDAALVSRDDINKQSYSNCLLAVAIQAKDQNAVLAGTTGMAFGLSQNHLTRRIEMMKRKKNSKVVQFSVAGCLTLALAGGVYASTKTWQTSQVSLIDAKELITETQSDFPLEINSMVLEQINYFIGNENRKAAFRDALQRIESHQTILDKKLVEYNLPKELLAVGIAESYFINHTPSTRHPYSAGIWQIIPNTARALGLTVNNEVDERINVELSTDAAFRLLTSDFSRFEDWRLAILSYNAGTGTVTRGIQDTGSHDAWELIRRGYKGDPNYLARVIAAAVLLNNQHLVD